MKRRLWKRWPGRLYGEFNTVGGILGVIGVILAFVPILADMPLESFFWCSVLVVGGGLFIVLCVFALVKSWPMAVKTIDEVMGSPISMDVLETVDPPPFRVGIVGPSYSGKTTLMRGVAAQPQLHERTVGVAAMVVRIPTSNNRAIALIDGGGQFYADQFRVAESAEMLIVVLDHNQSETEQRLSRDRLQEHRDFGNQLRAHLKRGPKKNLVFILANKSDVWKTLDAAGITAFRNFLAEQKKAWQECNLFGTCNLAEHSNKSADDMAAVNRMIGENA